MYMTRKSSEKRQRQPGAGAVDAEELYRHYLRIRAKRDTSGNEADQTVTELKNTKSGDIHS
jgi:hypothetical protein